MPIYAPRPTPAWETPEFKARWLPVHFDDNVAEISGRLYKPYRWKIPGPFLPGASTVGLLYRDSGALAFTAELADSGELEIDYSREFWIVRPPGLDELLAQAGSEAFDGA